jgi:hypothetical protein
MTLGMECAKRRLGIILESRYVVQAKVKRRKEQGSIEPTPVRQTANVDSLCKATARLGQGKEKKKRKKKRRALSK